MSISADDQARIAGAIHAAEALTSGEIVCVLAQKSHDRTRLPILGATVVSLALPWLLVSMTALPVFRILSFQILAFVAVMALLSVPRVQILLMPRAVRCAVAHREAIRQFVARGIAHTKDRTGILIFVSLEERYARIVADEGIAARVVPREWQGAVDDLVKHMSDDRIAEGYLTAIKFCGEVLAKHFPVQKFPRNELRNRIYLV